MNDQMKTFLENFLFALVRFRILGIDQRGDYQDWSAFGRLHGRLSVALELGLITHQQSNLLDALIRNADDHKGLPFPDKRNAGPCISWFELHKRTVVTPAPENPAVIHMGGYDFVDASLLKPHAQVPANEKPDPVSAPAPCRELRLLCLLVETATESYAVPLGTMHSVPPRASINGRWPSAGSPGVVLRETHAQRPTAQVLARLQRHGQTHAIRATARTVQLGVTA